MLTRLLRVASLGSWELGVGSWKLKVRSRERRCANQMSAVGTPSGRNMIARKGKTGRSRKTLPAPIRQDVRRVGCSSGTPERCVAGVKSNASAIRLRPDAPCRATARPSAYGDRARCLRKGIGGKSVRRRLHGRSAWQWSPVTRCGPIECATRDVTP